MNKSMFLFLALSIVSIVSLDMRSVMAVNEKPPKDKETIITEVSIEYHNNERYLNIYGYNLPSIPRSTRITLGGYDIEYVGGMSSDSYILAWLETRDRIKFLAGDYLLTVSDLESYAEYDLTITDRFSDDVKIDLVMFDYDNEIMIIEGRNFPKDEAPVVDLRGGSYSRDSLEVLFFSDRTIGTELPHFIDTYRDQVLTVTDGKSYGEYDLTITSQLQNKVDGYCPDDEAIREISENGSVDCEPIFQPTSSNPITINSTHDDVTIAAGQTLVTVKRDGTVLITGTTVKVTGTDINMNASNDISLNAGNRINMGVGTNSINMTQTSMYMQSGSSKINVDPASMYMQSGSSRINVDPASIAIDSAGTMDINAGTTMDIRATGSMDIEGSAILNLKGGLINLN